ncbi:HAD-IA family hydrolase [Actinoplanes sp. NPDC049681]|uniref:HAD-IA family hydrolase n=1 Tax=Actinoplanes sp. NPDC049681 TaxID=3363905 RepID=UPI0037B8D860
MTERCVLLDIGGVLEITPPTGWGARWERRLGLPFGELNRRLADVWAAGSVGAITEGQVGRRIAERLGLDDAALAAFLGDLWEQYLGTANEELIDHVRGLRGRCRLGILSNSFVGAREREERAYAFGSLVDEIVYSHEAGLLKPDPAVFALACDRLGTRPADCLFVDDHGPHVAAARAAGLHAVHFTGNAGTISAIGEFLK